MTLQQWAAGADRVCARAQSRLATVEAPGSLADVPGYVDATTPIVEKELQQLRALPQPDDDRVDDYLGKVDDTLKSAREVGAAAARVDEAEARAKGGETQRLTREAAEVARQLGARKCASQ